MASKLSQGAVAILDRKVDDIFDRLLTRLLGGAFTGKTLFLQPDDHHFTLPGIFHAATEEEGGYVDTDVLHGLAQIAQDYLDKARADAKATTKRRIQGILYDIDAGKLEQKNYATAVEGELSRLWDGVRSSVERVVLTEGQLAQTMGTKSAIEQLNANLGIDDPVVCFLVVNDDRLCDECRRTHLLSDSKTPRAWKSSEVSHDYHKRGDDFPSYHLMHPHCRCALASIMPGFGFDGNGRITYIGEGFSELAYQRDTEGFGGVEPRRKWMGLGKSERPWKLTLKRKLKSAADLTPDVLADMRQIAAKWGNGCQRTSEHVGAVYGLRYHSGAYRLDDGRNPEHYWNELDDGTIVDATASQFGVGDGVHVVGPDHPHFGRYNFDLSDEERETAEMNGYDPNDYSKSEPLEKASVFDHKWFKGSHVAHPDGTPKVVYHGTAAPKDIQTFDTKARAVTDDGYMGVGTYFHEDPEMASGYADINHDQRIELGRKAGGERVMPVHLSIKNPYYQKDGADCTYGMTRRQALAWTKARIAEGYDGATNGHGEWVAFHPHQIRSAITYKSEDLDKSLRIGMSRQDFAAHMQRFGWVFEDPNKHWGMKHSISGQRWKGFSHSDPHSLDHFTVKVYGKQVGLTVKPGPKGTAKLVAKVGHPHEQHYRKVPGLTDEDFG